MRGPSAIRTTFGRLEQRLPLLLGKAAFRADQHGERQPRARGRGQRRHRVLHLGVLVAEHQQATGIGLSDRRLERDRLGDLRQRQNAALLRRLDHIGAHAVEIDARHLGVPGDHRLQARGPHLHRLLHQIIEPGMLERGKQKMQIGRARLLPQALADNAPSAPVCRRRRAGPAIRRRGH